MSHRTIRLALASLSVALVTSSVFAGEGKGQARLVERRGPEVEVRQNAPGHIVVLFPGASHSDNPANDVEIVLVESQLPQQASEGQPQGQPQSTGREIVFCSRDADRGLVSYSLDANGNGRKLMVLARVGGQAAEVRQIGGGDGVLLFAVQTPQKPEQPEQAAQQNPQPEANAGQEPQAQPQEAPPQAQLDQSQDKQLTQAGQAAIILVHTGANP